MKRLFCGSVVAIGCYCFLLMANRAEALTILNFGDGHELGFVSAGLPAGDLDVTGYVNQLIGMAPGASTSISGNTFDRSSNNFGPLDPAILVLPRGTYSQYQDFSKDLTSLVLTLGSGYQYLLAKYDGPNSGTEVWYVGNLSGTVQIPTFNGQYGLSGTSFFTAGVAVPEGSATVALLGFALVSLGWLRRRVC